uniref:Putative scarecrow-like protein 22 n=1 Tax=Davidia involucrata TaxID=16924 RepID=A0A5B6ZUS1_DAVIN
MRGMQYNLQGKGVLGVAGFGSISSSEAKWKQEGSCASNEPISVLDTRRSPSPSTSTSTLSSSFGGGGTAGSGGSGSTDNTASVASVSESNPQQKWPVSMPLEIGSAAVTESAAAVGGGGSRKDEWATELQPIPAGLEVSGAERFGLGLEDWESLLSESGQDQSLLRWIVGDVDDASFGLKQLLQSANPNEIDDNVALGIVDQNSSFIPVSTGGSTGNAMTSSLSCGGGGSGLSSNDNNSGNIGSTTPNSSSVICKSPNVGLNSNPQNSITTLLNNSPLPVSVPPGAMFQQQFETPDEKPQIFNPQMFMNQQVSQVPQYPQSQNCFSPLLYTQQDHLNPHPHPHPHHLLQPQPKRQNLGVPDPRSQIPNVPFFDPGIDLLLRKQQLQLVPPHHQKPLMVPKQEAAGEQMAARQNQQQQQVVYDQLYKAAELILAGNFPHAQGILARLNHQLSAVGKPFQRAAFYFKEALQLPLLMQQHNPATATSLPPPRSPTPFDGMFKMGAYKVLSEVSPLIQFMNFTSNQAFLEALDDAERIHIIDFDVGFGAQWASFMQELPSRNKGTPSLKITAFASPSTHHPLELALMHENLTQFANEIGINFELEIVNFDSFDPNSYPIPPLRSSENVAIAVNFPIWSCSSHPSALPTLLRFIKQLSPKIVVSLDCGCERMDLPFPQHLLHALQYYEVLLDSIEASNVTLDTVNKIERFLFLPRIENIVLGRLSAPDKMPHCKALFASAGFSPVAFSNFTETQAECVVKRTPGMGFHVEKQQVSLVLCRQRRELMSASAWRC